nr:hypothetical protein CFP56_55423 [Quercus suber]
MKKRLNIVCNNISKILIPDVTIHKKKFKNFNYTSPDINDMEEIIGLEEQAGELESMLLNQSLGFTTIGIVGMGGMGKSMLVKKVFINPRVQMELLKRVWICLSNILE